MQLACTRNKRGQSIAARVRLRRVEDNALAFTQGAAAGCAVSGASLSFRVQASCTPYLLSIARPENAIALPAVMSRLPARVRYGEMAISAGMDAWRQVGPAGRSGDMGVQLGIKSVVSLSEALEPARRSWWRFVAIGALLVGLGCLGVALVAIGGVGPVGLAAGLLAAGAGLCVHGLSSRRWHGFKLDLVSGALHVAAGVAVWVWFDDLAALRRAVAAFLAAEGAVRVLFALSLRPMPRWFWIMLHGILAAGLAGMIIADWVGGAAWSLAVLVGVDLIAAGWAMVLVGVSMHSAVVGE